MARIERFEDLECWKESRILVCEIYKLCKESPLTKDFTLQDQLKRAALSSMNNIAEGFGRYHSKEFIRFLDISQSSVCELKSMIYVLEDLQYLSKEKSFVFHKQADKIKNLTLGLNKYLDKKSYLNTLTPANLNTDIQK